MLILAEIAKKDNLQLAIVAMTTISMVTLFSIKAFVMKTVQ